MKIERLLNFIIISLGITLTIINLYGLSQDIRVKNFNNKYLRFSNDQPTAFAQSISDTKRLPHESDVQFASRMTQVVAEGLSHIEWFDFPPEQFNQLIPIWENYFLYFMGKFSGIPEFERYHYANYKRSLKRGIGLCGDASMTLSQILDIHQIKNKILTFPGHVVVWATFASGEEYVLDPDFGVVVPYSSRELAVNSARIAELYLQAGYTQGDFNFFNSMYSKEFGKWHGVQHFITKKYYFEMISYWLKWPLPIGMIILSCWLLCRQRKSLSIKN